MRNIRREKAPKIHDFNSIFYIYLETNMAAGNAERSAIRELEAKLEALRKFFETLTEMIDKASTEIHTTKTQLQNEIKNIGEIKIQTQVTQRQIELDEFTTLRNTISGSVTELINLCKAYQHKHRSNSQV